MIRFRLPDFGAAASAAGGAPGGLPVAGFSVAGLAGDSAERRATVSSETAESGESAETSRAKPPSAASGSARTIRAAWSLAAAIRPPHYLQLHGAGRAQTGPPRRQPLN